MAFYRVTAQSLELRDGPSSGRSALKKWSSGVVSALAMCLVMATWPKAQQCSSGPNVCRETAPGGALLHNPNSKGNRVWTTGCGPNTMKPGLDPICHQISSCPAAGGFGKFLQAVTFDCKMKHFDGYFGLDGMTFGILDWTSNNLPPVLKAYQQRNRDEFDKIFGKLSMPMKDGCLDAKWACDNNKKGNLMCDASFHDAFATAIKTADFQKAEVDFALTQYENRLKRFADLALKTEYGNTAIAVLANNLLDTAACKPATWKKVCAGQVDETKMVDCMLDQYAKNRCRGGTKESSEDRVKAIKAVFAGAPPSENIHPTADDVISCSNSWGTASK
jgi:hypothetical protein